MFTLSVTSPSCFHGPMLSIVQPGDQCVRYVCSAFREQSNCKRDSRISVTRWPVNKVQSVRPQERGYCRTCDCLFVCSTTTTTAAENEPHSKHETQVGISDQLLKMPSFLLTPLSNSGAHAQYLFSLESLNNLYSILHQLDVQFVICIGTPRLHEFIQLERVHRRQSMESFLLDLDVRLGSFYRSDRFARFNMINGHFFTSAGRTQLKKFASLVPSTTAKYLLVCDPPFDAPLVLVLEQMRSLSREFFGQLPVSWTMHSDRSTNPPMFLVLPHFFDKKLRRMADEFALLDYKITYANHPRLDWDAVNCEGNEVNKGRRRDSVVRLFTNLSPAIVLPPEKLQPQFRFCEKCKRYSAKTNMHCDKCKTCPTKHGSTYVHCDLCDRCQPANRVHCARCAWCVTPGQCPHQAPSVPQQKSRCKRRRL